jgi:hypothetical protein
MACDIEPTRNWYIAAGVLAGVSSAAVGTAIGLNHGILTAPASPVAMGVAVAAAGGAAASLGVAALKLDQYCGCLGGACSGECTGLKAAITGAATAIGAQIPACVAAAVGAWIPFAGAPPMYVVLGSLVAQLAALVSGIALFALLGSCAERAPGQVVGEPGVVIT